MFEAPKHHLKVSREGIVLIKSFEGFRPRAERRDAGGWIIGYGHTLSAREGATVSQADAELLLQYDLLPVAQTINAAVGGAVNQHQFDALVSFAFSVGVDRFRGSDVLQRLNAGAAREAADAMVGWPEPVIPAPSLRRRAAERALFVADPASPVALSDLLSAPLPPTPEPASAPESPVVEHPAVENPAVENPAVENPVAEPPVSEALVHDAPFVVVDDVTPMDAAPADLGPDISLADIPVEHAAPADPLPDALPSTAEIASTDDAGAIVQIPVFGTVGTPPADQAALARAMMQQRYSPYGASVVGPLPGLAAAAATPPPSPDAAAPDASDAAPEPQAQNPQAPNPQAPNPQELNPQELNPQATELAAEPIADGSAVAPASETQPEPEQGLDAAAFSVSTSVEGVFLNAAPHQPSEDGLVLTPLTDDQVLSTPRQVWPRQDGTPEADQAPLFDDDGALSRLAAPVVRHETSVEQPPAFQWGQTGAYVVMGMFGLVSFGMSMAAFRLASQRDSGGDETTMIAWVLAVIGAACVGVSAYNLYRRWGRADA